MPYTGPPASDPAAVLLCRRKKRYSNLNAAFRALRAMRRRLPESESKTLVVYDACPVCKGIHIGHAKSPAQIETLEAYEAQKAQKIARGLAEQAVCRARAARNAHRQAESVYPLHRWEDDGGRAV